ncbi:MAG: hypothetical protein Q9184_005709 [Pyrenodesmia sp. 2 TL-2023]
MYTPFNREVETRYGAVRCCVQNHIDDFNRAVTEATEEPTGEDVNCAICHDSLASSDGGTPKLAMLSLPDCGHKFHEVCLMQWLSPIKLPATEKASTRSPDKCTDKMVYTTTPALNDINPSSYGQQTIRMIELGLDPLISIIQQQESMRDEPGTFDPQELILMQHEAIRDLEASDDDLEEGEINEGLPNPYLLSHPFYLPNVNADTQDLPPVNLFAEDPYDLDYDNQDPSIDLSGARSHCCPLCRQPAFGPFPTCHSDTLQLLRIRCRITDIAYAILKFDRTAQEESDREGLVKFLHRRHHDNLALDEREIIPLPSDARLIFKHARWTLRRSAYRYMKIHNLTATEQLRIVQLATIFENLHLKDADIPYMFNPVLKNIPPTTLTLEAIRELNEDPKEFLKWIIFRRSAGVLPTEAISDSEEDEDMVDAVDEEDLADMESSRDNDPGDEDSDSLDDGESEDSVS